MILIMGSHPSRPQPQALRAPLSEMHKKTVLVVGDFPWFERGRNYRFFDSKNGWKNQIKIACWGQLLGLKGLFCNLLRCVMGICYLYLYIYISSFTVQ